MWLIDLILNIAAVLLWLKWLERDVSTILAEPRISVVANLRRTAPRPPRILYLGALLLLIVGRWLVYWLLGSALDWIPVLHFGPIPLAFRSYFEWRILLYSFLSFGEALAIFYLALLLFSIVNRRLDDDPVQKLVRSHLGVLDSWPVVVKLLIPWLFGLLVWCAFNPLFQKIRIVVPPGNLGELMKQAAVVGLGVYLVWKYVLAAVLILYVCNSYIYFGKWPFWNFIEQTGRQILMPLRRIPLCLRKVDFAPFVALAIVLFAGELASQKLLEHWTGKNTQTIERLRR